MSVIFYTRRAQAFEAKRNRRFELGGLFDASFVPLHAASHPRKATTLSGRPVKEGIAALLRDLAI